MPTLCFAGLEDGTVDIEIYNDMPSAFKNYFELVKVPSAGHFIHCEQPEIFVNKLLEFLKRPDALV